jgi:L-aminopeptidase/D-esterase-like protein
MRYLEEKGIGHKVGTARVPIVPAAILFDLGLGKTSRRPDAEMGYQAASCANIGTVEEGNVGAGTGATVGKIFGMAGAMKSGLGTACMDIGAGILVGAITAVNAFGDVIDPQTNQIIAGARQVKIGPVKSGSGQFADTMDVLQTFTGRAVMKLSTSANTVISVVATNARLDKAQATKVAQMAHDGLARVVRPAHTMLDGDTVFVLATGAKAADVSLVGAFAAEVLAQAIVNAVRSASPAAGLPSATSLQE